MANQISSEHCIACHHAVRTQVVRWCSCSCRLATFLKTIILSAWSVLASCQKYGHSKYHNGNGTDSMFFFIPTDFLGLGWRSTMDERNQGLFSESSAVRNNHTRNANICPALLAACCNSGSFWHVLCILFLLYSTDTGSADSSWKVYNCLWPYSAVSRYW